MLTVVTPAADRNLLTPVEMRLAAGLDPTDASQDAALAELNATVSAAIAAACRVRRAGAAPVTLRSELLEEVIRIDAGTDALWLSRRPVTALASVSCDGILVDDPDREFDGWQIFRLSGSRRACWSRGRYVISYTAGWAVVPDELKAAAKRLVAGFRSEEGRDPSLKRVEIPGIITREWWVGPKDDPLIPADVAVLLAPFVSHAREPSP